LFLRRKLQRLTVLDKIWVVVGEERGCMTDYFVLLDEPRRPWLDPDALKAKFLTLAAKVHPDRVNHASEGERRAAHQRYTELNAAFQCLREAKERLRHLLELERGTKPDDVQKISSGMADLFTEVSELCREADQFLAEKARLTSPLLKAQLFERGMALSDRLTAMLQKLNAKYDALTEQILYLNMAWESAPPIGSPARGHVLPLSRLEHLYRDISYLSRWQRQIQDRSVQLSF
jgi:DnaJ-domain-containing protein 1